MGKGIGLLIIILLVLIIHLINVDESLREIKDGINDFLEFWFSIPILRNMLDPIEKFYSPKLPISFFEYRFFIFLVFLFCFAWVIDVTSQVAIRKYKQWKYSKIYDEAELIDVDGYLPKKDFKLFATCKICSKKIYMPLKCSYCGDYYCDRHFLPPNHDCEGIESWKKRRCLLVLSGSTRNQEHTIENI